MRANHQLPPTPPQPGIQPTSQAMCPDGELNWQTFDAQDAAKPTEPYQPRIPFLFKKITKRLQCMPLLSIACYAYMKITITSMYKLTFSSKDT